MMALHNENISNAHVLQIEHLLQYRLRGTGAVPFSPDCYITYRITAGVSSLFRITETGFSA